MSKVSGTYPSLSRGVNQQPFEARLDGQHGEQVNLWSDPVHGLSRRRGTTLQYCYADNVFGPSYHQLPDDQKQELRDFYASYRTVPYVTDGLELQVHYPTKPQPVWMQDIFSGGSGGIRVTRKIQGSGPLQPGADVEPVGFGIFGETEYNATIAAMFKGIAAACQVGRYMLFMPNDTAFAVPAEVDTWASVQNNSVAFEIRAGVPNRTYAITAMLNGVAHRWPYTTPSSAYSGTLTTTDIPANDPEYQKKVNDRVNAYNSAVTQWITTAAQQTRPAYIASQLVLSMDSFVVAHGGRTYQEENGIILYFDNGSAVSFTITDGADGSGVAMAEKTVTSTSALPGFHWANKVVRIKPERGDASFYVRAVAQPGSYRVRWEECPSTSQAPIQNHMLVMAVKNPQASSGLSSVGLARATPSGLAYLASNKVLNDPSVLSLPNFNGRQVGDPDSSPPPRFFGKQITWMGMFQDRLCIAAGNSVDMSEVGNYFNFFRTQTLTVPDSDPVSIYALGSEADTLRSSVIFDRSLLLFGDTQQYSIDGRNPVTPSTSTIIQSSAIEDATDCPPVAGGSLVFFGKRRENSAEIFQMEVGDVADTSNFTGLGLQLSDYIPGRPAQLLYVASPSTLFVRCSEAPHSVFVFRFIDQNRQRVMDSWSRFDYHPAFGIIYGMFYHEDALYYRVAREAWVDGAGVVWTGGRGDFGFDVVERQSLLPQVAGMPYLDSMRKADYVYENGAYGSDWYGRNYPFLSTVFTRDRIANIPTGAASPKSADWLHGITPNIKTRAEWDAAFSDLPTRSMDYCVMGLAFDSYVELTSPVRRDQSGQPIMQGRLTVARLDVHYKDAGGFTANVKSRYGIAEQYNGFDWSATDTAYGTVTALRFNGRVLGQAANMVGVVPVTSGSTSVFVGRESKDYVCKISSRGWMPLSITRVTWTGQWFLNHRFV